MSDLYWLTDEQMGRLRPFFRNRPFWAALIMRPFCEAYSRVASSMATIRGGG